MEKQVLLESVIRMYGGVEPFVANVYKKLKKGQPLNQRVRKVLEKHGNTSEQVKARKDAFAKDAFRQGQANRYGKSPRDWCKIVLDNGVSVWYY